MPTAPGLDRQGPWNIGTIEPVEFWGHGQNSPFTFRVAPAAIGGEIHEFVSTHCGHRGSALTLPHYNDFVSLYSKEPDESLLAALATGIDGYSPEAWRAISEEASRRGLTLQEAEQTLPPVEMASPERDVAPLPRWLSATLLVLACLFLLLQLLLLLAYYGLVDRQGAYFGSTGTLFLGFTAFTATRFVRSGPHARAARAIGLSALALTTAATIARL